MDMKLSLVRSIPLFKSYNKNDKWVNRSKSGRPESHVSASKMTKFIYHQSCPAKASVPNDI